MLICAWCGARSYYRLPARASLAPEERVLGAAEHVALVASTNFAFQVFNFLHSLSIPEHRAPLALAHHALAAFAAGACWRHRLLPYYAGFFLGVSEVSTLPLILVDLGRFFALDERGPLFAAAELSKGLFALAFLYFRGFLWFAAVLPGMVSDILLALRRGEGGGMIERHRPKQAREIRLVLGATLGIAAALSALQIYWAGLIVGEVAKMVAGAGEGGGEL
jgi:hypothetical protein